VECIFECTIIFLGPEWIVHMPRPVVIAECRQELASFPKHRKI